MGKLTISMAIFNSYVSFRGKKRSPVACASLFVQLIDPSVLVDEICSYWVPPKNIKEP